MEQNLFFDICVKGTTCLVIWYWPNPIRNETTVKNIPKTCKSLLKWMAPPKNCKFLDAFMVANLHKCYCNVVSVLFCIIHIDTEVKFAKIRFNCIGLSGNISYANCKRYQHLWGTSNALWGTSNTLWGTTNALCIPWGPKYARHQNKG